MSSIKNPQNTSLDTLLTRRQVADLLQILPHTLCVNREKWDSVLPIVRVSRLARYRRSDVERFIQGSQLPSFSSKGEADA